MGIPPCPQALVLLLLLLRKAKEVSISSVQGVAVQNLIHISVTDVLLVVSLALDHIGTRVFGNVEGVRLTMVNYTLYSRGHHFDLLVPKGGAPEVPFPQISLGNLQRI